MNIHIVVDLHLLFVCKQPVKPPCILLNSAFPRYRHGQKQCVKQGFIETFTDVLADGNQR
ncbi:MAG: hypothetical protein PHF56_05875 [Desulfuromonadaceae bacterium]|nr:hypothetical protein [Desulfuromonadaceae bacterium]